MSDDSGVLKLQLPGRAEAPSAARRALAALNGDLGLVSEERLRDVQLLVTELVANVVRHSDAEAVELDVRATEQVMRVEVSSASPAFAVDADHEPSLEGKGGWGLRIVDVV